MDISTNYEVFTHLKRDSKRNWNKRKSTPSDEEKREDGSMEHYSVRGKKMTAI